MTKNIVAKKAGVSSTTVSRVLNNNGYVSREKRKLVEKAIEELGYVPNLYARNLRTNKTHLLLFFIPELYNPYYMEVYQGMNDYAEKYGYSTVVTTCLNHTIIKQWQFDGIILPDLSLGESKDIFKLGIPIVVLDYDDLGLKIPSVMLEMKAGAILAVNHLIECGHERIAFIAPKRIKRSNRRFSGYRNTIKANGLLFQESYGLFSGSVNLTDYECGYKAGLKIIEDNIDITAIFSFNDVTAAGCIAGLYEKGLKIPEDISIVGFDDIIMSQYMTPALTTIHVPKYEQGCESVKLLLRIINKQQVISKQLKSSLIKRQSVKKLGV